MLTATYGLQLAAKLLLSYYSVTLFPLLLFPPKLYFHVTYILLQYLYKIIIYIYTHTYRRVYVFIYLIVDYKLLATTILTLLRA